LQPIPNDLAAWTIEVIEQLLADGVFESRFFDFKEALPAPNDHQGKLRLRKSLAAFANSDGGGFLIYGIDDDRTLAPAARMIGLDPGLDFPQHFSGYGTGCVPRVVWRFLNAPLSLATGRLIHVVEVLEGRAKPHGVLENERWIFPKRTDGGSEALSYEEIRDAFRDRNALRRTLLLIRSEATRMHKQAEELNREVWNGFYDFSMRFRFRAGLLDSVVAQVVDIEDDEGLRIALDALRSSAAAADVESARLLALQQGETRDTLGNIARQTISNAERVVRSVERLLPKYGPAQ
jgi:hypothetical protein